MKTETQIIELANECRKHHHGSANYQFALTRLGAAYRENNPNNDGATYTELWDWVKEVETKRAAGMSKNAGRCPECGNIGGRDCPDCKDDVTIEDNPGGEPDVTEEPKPEATSAKDRIAILRTHLQKALNLVTDIERAFAGRSSDADEMNNGLMDDLSDIVDECADASDEAEKWARYIADMSDIVPN